VQHANEDVEKMILGNKCDMADKRQVPRQKGEEVTAASFTTNIASDIFTASRWFHFIPVL